LTPAYEVVGQGEPVVLIPGTFGNRRSWLKQVGALSGRFQLLLFDPRGAGDTPDPGSSFTPDDLADDVLAAMDAAGIERAHLVGHSLGAHLALLIAARWPHRAHRVVAAAPTLFMDPYLLSVMDTWETLARSDVSDHGLHLGLVLLAFGRETFERLVPAIVREMDRQPMARGTVQRYVECDRRQDLRGMAGRIEAQVLVVCGSDDALPGPGQARAVARAIPGAQVEILAGLGHSPHLEAPPAFNRLVTTFLTR
jgi:pimeloyl-ACP methyl ester carboxylesterase